MSGVAAPDSTNTRGIKESEANREVFGQCLVKLMQVQTRLAKEKKEHAQRSEKKIVEMDEMRKRLSGIKMEGRIRQGKVESSIIDLKIHREALADTQSTEMMNTRSPSSRSTEIDVRIDVTPEPQMPIIA